MNLKSGLVLVLSVLLTALNSEARSDMKPGDYISCQGIIIDQDSDQHLKLEPKKLKDLRQVGWTQSNDLCQTNDFTNVHCWSLSSTVQIDELASVYYPEFYLKFTVTGSPVSAIGLQPKDRLTTVERIDFHFKTNAPFEFSESISAADGEQLTFPFERVVETKDLGLDRFPNAKAVGFRCDLETPKPYLIFTQK